MSFTRRDALTRLTKSIFGGAAVAALGPLQALAETTQYNFKSGGSGLRSNYKGKKTVSDPTGAPVGDIVVNTRRKKLYFVLPEGRAIEYGVGVGRQGFGWKGKAYIARKAKWPTWYPTKRMRERELKQYGRKLPVMMEGGPNNPLGARALYLFQDGEDTLYRIHGTTQPWTIGTRVSSGCIRMVNEEVIDLYNRVRVGAKVTVV